MSAVARIADNQAQIFLGLLRALHGRWRTDHTLPTVIQRLLAANAAFGSRDRRLYRELIYTTLRYLPWIEPWLDRDPSEAVRRVAWLAADTKDTQAFRAALTMGEPPAGDKTELLPAWFREHCPEIFFGPELDAQLTRAPLWIRLQTADPDDVGRILGEFKFRGWDCEFAPPPLIPAALRVKTDADVTKTDAYRTGLFEVQDLGSQLLLCAAPVAPGTRWLDACAGAGGKTLQLARLLGPTGFVDAHDIRPAALAELEKRSARARLANIRTVPRPDAAGYDGVLVDAPCSGSGTWRRAPHLKWTTRPAELDHHAARQLTLLRKFAAHVRPGGLLLYATCSLSRVENHDVAAAFLSADKTFVPTPLNQLSPHFGYTGALHTLTLLPARHDTDGFYLAAFRRR
jgi:16S rRNA (cytosine967-C5)-methyltransferase